MKKCLAVLFILCIIQASTAGCANRSASAVAGTVAAGADITETRNDLSSAVKNVDADVGADVVVVTDADVAADIDVSADAGVDFDLTALSSTMVYAEVYNIMTEPDDYIGKTIKMKGPYYTTFYEETNLYYHYVIVEDATACCAQGLEFIWNGEHICPDDYPEEESKIEVAGVFGSYDELGSTYYYLAVDNIFIAD